MPSLLALRGGAPLRTKPNPPWPISDANDSERLTAVLRSGAWSFDGPWEKEFSRQFAEYCGAAEVLCVANGSVSLELALRALRIGPGDEVIVPALTWVATAGAVVEVGATPVFADVRAQDWCIDPESVRARITPRTRAIIAVHLYARMADLDALGTLAARHGLHLIEDCAHAHGFQWRGRGAGTLGVIGSYSFQQSKVMTAGEGGALICGDPLIADRLYALKNCGRKRRTESCFGFGFNHRLTEFQAAVLIGQLARLEAQRQHKEHLADQFSALIATIPGVQTLPPQPQVTRRTMYGFPLRYEGSEFARAPVDLLVEALRAEGVPVQRTYDVVYQSPLWTARSRQGSHGGSSPESGQRCPVAEEIARSGLVLLHFNFLGEAADVSELAAALAKVQQHAGDLRMEGLKRTLRHAGAGLLRELALRS
ncbi:MAG: DegT/DnrJ/EryC1/StrS family aminotransferase [Opitutus sp.]|nr:DegT/DnrJ/EryC1/StrS family aminotransferase [Opitutus sp.]